MANQKKIISTNTKSNYELNKDNRKEKQRNSILTSYEEAMAHLAGYI